MEPADAHGSVLGRVQDAEDDALGLRAQVHVLTNGNELPEDGDSGRRDFQGFREPGPSRGELLFRYGEIRGLSSFAPERGLQTIFPGKAAAYVLKRAVPVENRENGVRKVEEPVQAPVQARPVRDEAEPRRKRKSSLEKRRQRLPAQPVHDHEDPEAKTALLEPDEPEQNLRNVPGRPRREVAHAIRLRVPRKPRGRLLEPDPSERERRQLQRPALIGAHGPVREQGLRRRVFALHDSGLRGGQKRLQLLEIAESRAERPRQLGNARYHLVWSLGSRAAAQGR